MFKKQGYLLQAADQVKDEVNSSRIFLYRKYDLETGIVFILIFVMSPP